MAGLWKLDLSRPELSTYTLSLCFISALVYYVSTVLSINGTLPVWLAVLINGIAGYTSFTVLHECVHGNVSTKYPWLTYLAGQVSAALVTPLGIFGFKIMQEIHLAHHKECNDFRDPDSWTHGSNLVSLFFRCITLDFYYHYWFLVDDGDSTGYLWKSKKKNELLLYSIIPFILCTTAYIYLMCTGYHWEIFIYWLVPSRISVLLLAFLFDYLPHYPLTDTIHTDRYKTTYFLDHGPLQWLSTIVYLYQDYHIIHHLYPMVPFYRYATIWFNSKDELIAKGAPIRKVM
eukprot:TRINITY_DN7841_c0_g1_i1.p1 TRINITY_DN7841_c0_g1~~TRINITY_DN7841_c0_g1_i1.p1  ORF type:complete len:288 (+),score=7.08 TRINITY_DN7841_c0_g1_i1:25-888(+)